MDTIKILRDHNRWRRGDESVEQIDPKLIGEAIDYAVRAIVERDEAMKVLRQIAERKRRTQEQRLASACLRFLEAVK